MWRSRFNAALSHSPTDEIDPCPKIVANKPLPCVNAGLGSEPVCCGSDCKFGKCKDGVYRGKTAISIGTSEGCGAVSSTSNGGVLCCFDGEGNPTAEAAPGDAKAPEGDAKAPEGDAKEGETAAADAKAGDAKEGDAKAGDAKEGDAKDGDAKKGDAKDGDAKAEKKKPAKKDDAKAGDAKADEKAG